MQEDGICLDPDMTLSQLATRIGCSVDHLSRVINTEFGKDFHIVMNECRARHARDLLLEKSDDTNYVYHVADQVGFRSFEDFSNTFTELFGVTPAMFRSQNTGNIDLAN